jgi:mono/diheme cytochrome c family protein
VPRLVSVARGKAVIVVSFALLAGAVGAGCDTQEEADVDRGRDLFTTGCGTCHTLAEARTGATVGPNLDAAFLQARADGMDQDTVEGVVEDQIAHPRPVDEGDEDYNQAYMPADIYTGSDAKDVAAYVASVAGVEGIEPPPLGDGEDIFTTSCGGCHELQAAGTTGGVGPNLDEALADDDAEFIEQSIRDPEAEVAEGFEAGIMPPFSCDAIPQENLKDLINYLLESVGSKDTADKLPDECAV